jgi:DNA-directed RNA polymerase specialized sigma24 family protein
MCEQLQTMSQKLSDLQPRINATACRVFSSQPIPGLLDKDDIQQNINLRILERAAQIPNLPEQTDAYIMTDAARNGGFRSCIKEVIYLKYVQPESILRPDFEDDEENEFPITEFIAASGESPEDQVAFRQTLQTVIDRAEQLSPNSRDLLVLSLNGLADSEIAAELGVTRSAICQRRKRLAREFIELIN